MERPALGGTNGAIVPNGLVNNTPGGKALGGARPNKTTGSCADVEVGNARSKGGHNVAIAGVGVDTSANSTKNHIDENRKPWPNVTPGPGHNHHLPGDDHFRSLKMNITSGNPLS